MPQADYGVENPLSPALENNELTFFYQPRISLVSGKMTGVEALLRWTKPGGEIALPESFLPPLEESGVITEVTRHMFPRLLADMLILRDLDEELSYTFNISPRDLLTPLLVEDIRTAIDHYSIDPLRLCLEVTSASILNHWDEVSPQAEALRSFGVSLAVSGPGTDLSPLASLSGRPFTEVTLDREWLWSGKTQDGGADLIDETLAQANQLGLKIVAVGVENEESYKKLLRWDCATAQGYWFSEPLPLDELIAFRQQDRRWSGDPGELLRIAQLDHLRWRKALVEAISNQVLSPDAGNKEMTLEYLPPMDHRQCRLGQWYYGPGQVFRNHPQFQALETPHRDFHTMSKTLLEAVGEGVERSRLMEMMRELSEQSIHLVSLLQELESVQQAVRQELN